MKNSRIIMKNKSTGETEIINQYNIELLPWGLRFFVDSELAAYKAAYQYRNAPLGAKVEFAGGVGRCMVTVFNDNVAKGMDIFG